jgi:UDP-N-acetylglucosamine 2-epimerase (non-hydrolysing)
VKRLLFVFGTRPEAIKLAPVIKEAQKNPAFDVRVCVFRQHRRMLEEQLRTFEIKPDYDLPMPFGDRGLMHKKNPLRRIWSLFGVGWGALRFFFILKRERPDMLVVQGDTSTVFLASFIAFHFKIAIAHVEAGLRTYNKYSPFPEEMNRRLMNPLADLHFAPTEQAKQNLLSERVNPEKIIVTGNTVLDALRLIIEKQDKEGGDKWEKFLEGRYGIRLAGRKLLLVTAHRRESFGEGLRHIARALAAVAKARPEAILIYPVHLNPNVKSAILAEIKDAPNLILAEPIEYEPFVYLMRKAHAILTDSGGIQEEVSILGKPTLVMREVTERPEGITAGNAKLVGTDVEKIVAESLKLLDDDAYYASMAKSHTAFGDGHAAERITSAIQGYLESENQ